MNKSNLAIKLLGKPVVVTYRNDPGFGNETITLEDPVDTRVDSIATSEPGVPEQLQVEIDGDRWDDFRTFYVADSIRDDLGRIILISNNENIYTVSRIEDWGSYFSCLGERQQ